MENRATYNETSSRRLTGEQVGAIRLAAEIGNDIRKNYPEIAEEYRSGLTAPKLVATVRIRSSVWSEPAVAIDAVRNAIRGYSGHYYEPYRGLIEDRSERESPGVRSQQADRDGIVRAKARNPRDDSRTESRSGPQGRPHSGTVELRASDRLPRPVARGASRALPEDCAARRQGGRRRFCCGQGFGPIHACDARTGCGDRVRVPSGGGPALPGSGTCEFQKNRGESERGVSRRQSALYANHSENCAAESP